MAKVKDPFGAREARGSVGGITASRNTMGAYMRCKASPVQPRTSGQQERRYDFQKLVHEYHQLTNDQIQDWIDFAAAWPIVDAFGDSISATGLNWFITLNQRLLAESITLISSPPLSPSCEYTPTLDVAQNETSTGDIELTFSPDPYGDERIWVMYSNNLPRTARFAKKSIRLRTKVSESDSSPLTLIEYDDLAPDESLVQFLIFAVDQYGRATPQQRFTVYPSTFTP